MTGALRKRKSKIIISRLLKHPRFQKSQRVLLYVSFCWEVETRDLIRRALRCHKMVFVPRVNPRTKSMVFVQIHSLKDLNKGAFGILEPKGSLRSSIIKTSAADLMIVPAVALDSEGRRLGRGEAFYDRFLRKNKNCFKIGIVFREQLLQQVPADTHDMKVDEVICDG